MSEATSLFLNLLRVAAALVVFGVHCAQFWIPNVPAFTVKLAHGSVIIFFVLSGYVITYSTLSRRRSIKSYAVARLSRLYSVLLPALFLTFVLQTIGMAVGPALYTRLGRGDMTERYLLTLGFLQNIWQFSASPSSNNPAWSLSYEFWYYVLFAVAIFTRSPLRKLVMLLFVALIVGPNILLLLPCWLFGVVLYLLQGQFTVRRTISVSGFIFFSCVTLFFITSLRSLPYEVGQAPFLLSGAFISDWITAASVFFTIFFFDRAFGHLRPAKVFQSGVRFCSDRAYSLYLFHYPMIVLLTASSVTNTPNIWLMILYMATILSTVVVLSNFTERKRGAWRRFFDFGWSAGNVVKI
jgi:peptidoglycan/LPS O-acetylase OafA/YrhL